MQIVSAMLPEPPESHDRVFTTPNAAIVLDGASAFVPVEVSTGLYVDTLGGRLQSRILDDPAVDLVDALADAIEYTTAKLNLHPGASPSSTVAIARERENLTDLLVLGDTQIATPKGIFRDDRLDAVATRERQAYKARLRAGYGYDDRHRERLQALQAEQAKSRNRSNGYWIAETEPSAAMQGVRRTMPSAGVEWLVAATDGAYSTMEYLGEDDWRSLASLDRVSASSCLTQIHAWESQVDPIGRDLPRAKPHDDKTLLIARPEAPC